MPTYVYRCSKCDTTKEIWMPINKLRDRRPRCAECKSIMQRIPAITNFTLKGSGWAKDGYQK